MYLQFVFMRILMAPWLASYLVSIMQILFVWRDGLKLGPAVLHVVLSCQRLP